MATLSTGYVNAPMGLSLGSSGPSALPNHFTTDSLVYKFTGGTNAGSITGNVYSGGVPVARTVSVWDQDSKAFIGDAVSDATTGAFTVSGLNPSKVYFVSVADMVDTPFGLHQFGGSGLATHCPSTSRLPPGHRHRRDRPPGRFGREGLAAE